MGSLWRRASDELALPPSNGNTFQSSFSFEVSRLIFLARPSIADLGSAPERTIFCSVAAHSVVDWMK